MMLILLLLLAANAAPYFNKYAMSVVDLYANEAIVASDPTNVAPQMKQGRASTIILVDGSNTTSPSQLGTYPLFFNSSFIFSPPYPCTYVAANLSLFDLSDRGWLRRDTNSSTQGSLTYYWHFFNESAVFGVTFSPLSMQPYNMVLSLLVLQNGVPFSIGLYYGQPSRVLPLLQPIVVYNVTNFSTNFATFGIEDSAFAPPPDSCLMNPPRCWLPPGSKSPYATIDIYRSHGNDSFNHDLRNANGATAAGECYWACNYSPQDFVTHFRVTLDTRWNLYSECNGGICNFVESFAPQPWTYGMYLGVGREASAGGGMGDGYAQCFVADPGIGFWYSFNVMGMCAPGAPLGTRNCTWMPDYKVVKTITLACSAMQNNCQNGLTYEQQGALLEKAFKTCPSVNALENVYAPFYYEHVATGAAADATDAAADAASATLASIKRFLTWFQ